MNFRPSHTVADYQVCTAFRHCKAKYADETVRSDEYAMDIVKDPMIHLEDLELDSKA